MTTTEQLLDILTSELVGTLTRLAKDPNISNIRVDSDIDGIWNIVYDLKKNP